MSVVYPDFRRTTCHIPRQGFDPVAAIVWLILMPLSAYWGWKGFFWGVFAALHLLERFI